MKQPRKVKDLSRNENGLPVYQVMQTDQAYYNFVRRAVKGETLVG